MPEEGEIPEGIDENEGKATEEELEKDSEKISDETLEMTYSEESKTVMEARNSIKNDVEMINFAADTAAKQDVRDSTYQDGSDKGDVENEKPGERIKTKKDQAREYRSEEVGTQKRKGRLYARVKGINLLLGFISTAASSIALIVTISSAARACNGGDDDSQLTEEEKKKIEAQIRRWWALPETEVWEAIAKYCDRWNPSWQAQILMMDTIKDLSQNLNSPWTWRGDDEADLVDDTANAYADFTPEAKQHQSSAIYRYVASLTYDGFDRGTPVPLPRQVAADVAELAITDIVLKEDTARGG